MTFTRRTFLGLGTLISCGSIVGFSSADAAAPRALPVFDGDEKVFAFVRSYSAEFRVIGASVLGRIRASGVRSLHLLVKVERPDALLATVPFAGVYSQDNTLTFSLAEADVTIENLLPEVFAARLAAMAKRAGVAFAHDALVFNPDTNELSDPFDARLRAVRLVNKTFGSVAALDVILRGTAEAAQLRLAVGTEFSNWKARVLRSIARSADAPKLAATFLQHIANLPAGKIESLVRSRLVATALYKVFGIRVADAVAEFKIARATTSAETTDAAIWLSVLIAPEIESNLADGAATTWLQRGTRFQVIRSRRALAQAQALLTT